MVAEADVRLVQSTLPLLDAEERSGAALAAQIGVAEPVDWPPEYNDASTRAWMRDRLLANPADAGWMSYYILADIDGRETLAGTCGFKGGPDETGSVEVGYSIVDAYQRRGIGFAALTELIRLGFSDPRVRRITAETLPSPELAGSRAVLEKGGFKVVGSRQEEGLGEVLSYALERPSA